MIGQETLAKILSQSGVLGAVNRFQVAQTYVKILAYHRVLDFTEKDYPFDVELISATPEQFDWQLSYLTKYFTLITFADVNDFVVHGKPMPKNPVVITFDDGFEDFYSNVFPQLKRYGVPATVFITTDAIGQDHSIWFDHVVLLIKANVGASIRLNDGAFVLDIERGNQSVSKVLDYLKTIPNPLREEALVQLGSQLVNPDAKGEGSANSRMLSWDMVKEMNDWGVEIGSHTCSHPVLSQLTKAEIFTELNQSKRVIERQLGRKVVAIAYPVGGPNSISTQVFELAQEVGYRFGLSYIDGVSKNYIDQRFCLRRIRVERYLSKALFSARLSLPSLFKY